jgi:hypothetical protein
MKKYYIILASLIIFCSCAKNDPVSPPVEPPIPKDSLAVVTGTVKDISGIPIRAASIHCQNTVGNSYYSSTDSLGKFKIREIKAGNYNLTVFKNGFASDTTNFIVNNKDSINLNFQLHQTLWYKINENANYLRGFEGFNGLYVNPQLTIFTTTELGGAMGYQSGMMKTSNFGLNWFDGIDNNATTRIFKASDDKLFIFTDKWQDGNGHYLGENKFYRSFDYGNTWTSLVDFNLDQVDGCNVVFANSIYYLNIVGEIYPIIGTNFKFYISNDQGNSWNSYSPIDNYKIISVNKTTSGKIYIQNYSDSVYYSTNGSNWNLKIITNSNLKYYLRNFVILPNGEMIVASNSNYYISNDDGESFNQVNSNLNSNLPNVNKFVYNSLKEIYCYYSGDYGVTSGCLYKSTNNCVTMQKYDEGLPESYYVSGLFIRDDYAYLLCDGYVYRTSKKTTESEKINMKDISIRKIQSREKSKINY